MYEERAIEAVYKGMAAYTHFLTANDTGLTGGHQSGIYVSKPSAPILFDRPGRKGSNMERRVRILWQDGSRTDTRFIYYGQGSRNEYRMTNFGRGFPYLRPEYTGSLFVLVKMDEEDYEGYVLSEEEEIEAFLGAFGMGPAETNRLIDLEAADPDKRERYAIEDFIRKLDIDFPAAAQMSEAARNIEDMVYDHKERAVTDPDRKLLSWTDTEFRLFKALERDRYSPFLKGGFRDVDSFVAEANKVLNRRKSRAGKSLENHLAAVFDRNLVAYTPQAVTEGNKRPDFIFPSEEAYHTPGYPAERLISLAAKTTCKDRWRQVLNEADRLKGRTKFLCTLQQGISAAQMDEMQAEMVTLVVPAPYIKTYPKDRQERIWTLKQFVGYAKACISPSAKYNVKEITMI